MAETPRLNSFYFGCSIFPNFLNLAVCYTTLPHQLYHFYMRLLSTFLLFFLGFSALQAQAAKDITVPLTATLNTGPTSITLTWPNPGNANLLILRRTKGQAGNSWVQALNVAGSNLTSITDLGVANGQIYEYVIQRTLGTLNAFGYAHVAVNANPVNSRGKILVFVDSTTASAATVELEQLKNDLRGDGWWPITFQTGPSSTVPSVKAQIVAAYNADPTNVKSVLLIGNIPIPYSGNAAWDGHVPDHEGAWPADSYYADVNGVWTDNTVNNVVPNRAANDNVPGDGKFDQNFIPTAAELQVGRIDFRRLDPAAFGAADHVALLKRYLTKNHKWRNGQYVVDNKAIIDDNFGYFGGEAFASNGWRNAYPLVGEANIVEADYFNDTNPQSYLMGFGCGGGNYNGAGGVGSSANFATDSVNIVFSNLFGSYFGDWDFETNPFMPSALASRGGILNCSWAGRPHHFYQALASGETIGYVMWETMNAQFNNGFYGSFGESGAHIALLGDPTIRASVVKPATNLTITAPTCNRVVLNWTASADAVTGYHVYRSLSLDGLYSRLTATPVTGTTFTDNIPALDTLYYQVRAIKNVTNPGGGTYVNNATGVLGQIIFIGAGGPTVTATNGTLTCTSLSTVLNASASAPISTWSWVGPNNFSSSQQNPTVTVAGTYTVTAVDGSGCSGTATATVVGDFAAPTLDPEVSNSINCANTTATITVPSAGISSCIISGPGGFFVQGFEATVSTPGTYTITATSATNGCIGNASVVVIADTAIPTAVASNGGALTCTTLSTELVATTNAPAPSFVWSGPCVAGTTASCQGLYTVTVTNTSNGCTNTATTMVMQDIAIPTVIAQAGVITCNDPSATLSATSNIPGVSFVWTGPCLSAGNPPEATCAGNYVVVVTNPANGCTNSATALVIEDTVLPMINFPPLGTLSCSTPCVDFVVPGIPEIEIYILGQLVPPGTAFQICQPGTYTVTLKSTTNGCTQDMDIVVTQDNSLPVANAGPDAVLSCNSPSVQLSGAGSSSGPAFVYYWSGPNGFTSGFINPTVNVTGTYVLVVTNITNDCSSSDMMTVLGDPSLPAVNATVSGPINCANPLVMLQSGNNDPNATYAWSGPNGYGSSLANPMVFVPGTYTVVVSVGNCMVTDNVLVTAAPDLVVNAGPNVVNCNGSVQSCINPSGGTPPYNVLWSNGSTTNCALFAGGGLIGVTVTDGGGCSFELSETVVTPTPLIVGIQASVGCTGFAIVCAGGTGGTAPYTYKWSSGASLTCVTYLNGGTYTVTATDAAGCTAVSSITLVIPPGMTTTAAITDESAPNANNGAINLTVSGGTAPFQYLWSNNATTQDISNLPGGNYSVVVTDANGCTHTAAFSVLTTSATNEAQYFEQFQLSPNPTEGLASLSLKLHAAAELRVEVRDMAGRLIWGSPSLKTDALVLPIDLTNSPAGMYSVSVWVENQVFVRKLAVLR